MFNLLAANAVEAQLLGPLDDPAILPLELILQATRLVEAGEPVPHRRIVERSAESHQQQSESQHRQRKRGKIEKAA
ncbi:hypothetical protein C7450_101879 [Chelatococcus asaccharovorans]|uniref:Uncharacterized protein n=1 Tax=Chelatococcus asaccharovorans TaxID=28210 RepID=A0A2V3UIX1_9HYPH|nr:hypothetical protein C7450_101879 [Chelatococcus asaccharovorans]